MKVVERIGPVGTAIKMASRSSVENITCVCGEVVLSFRNRNYLKVVLAGK